MPLDRPQPADEPEPARPTLTRPSRAAAVALFATAGAAAGVTALFGGMAALARSDFESTQLERTAQNARDRFYGFEGAAIGLGAAAAVLTGVGAYLWVRAGKPATPQPLSLGPGGLQIRF